MVALQASREPRISLVLLSFAALSGASRIVGRDLELVSSKPLDGLKEVRSEPIGGLDPLILWEADFSSDYVPHLTRVNKVELLRDDTHPHEQQVKLNITAPSNCKPCEKGRTLRADFCGNGEGRADITLEKEVWAGDSFEALAPAPDPVLKPHRLDTDGKHDYFVVSPPDCKLPGQYLLVKMPEGIYRSVKIPENWKRHHGVFFGHAIKAAKEEAKVTERALSNEGRCCCFEPFYCVWFRNDLLKHRIVTRGEHCPRLQEYDDGRPTCARARCGKTAKNRADCHRLHHGPGRCELSNLTRFRFQGPDCGKKFKLFH